jgi:hypothetical protein
MIVFWDVTSCSLVEIVRRFGGAYCLHRQVPSLLRVPFFSFMYVCVCMCMCMNKCKNVCRQTIHAPMCVQSHAYHVGSSSSVALEPGSGLGLPLRAFVMFRYVRCGVISPTINLLLVILIRPPETSIC